MESLTKKVSGVVTLVGASLIYLTTAIIPYCPAYAEAGMTGSTSQQDREEQYKKRKQTEEEKRRNQAIAKEAEKKVWGSVPYGDLMKKAAETGAKVLERQRQQNKKRTGYEAGSMTGGTTRKK